MLFASEPILKPVRLCVLASSSSGNCAALVMGRGDSAGVVLLDCGLSPRRTRRLLGAIGLDMEQVDHVLLTHLDVDHWQPGWSRAMPDRVRVWIHRTHRARAQREGLLARRMEVFDDEFEPCAGARVRPMLVAHDSHGAVAMRIGLGGSAALGWATDIGHVTPGLIELLRGVDVLGIESNYCPRMQLASSRPEFLKRRIMGGEGHLSNAQCAEAVRGIAPRRTVILLHLSRECNHPELARGAHSNPPPELLVAPVEGPSPWVTVAALPSSASAAIVDDKA